MSNVTIDRLLNLVPDKPEEVLSALKQNPSLASASDSHGYTLLHASVSYDQPDLLRTLVHEYSANINIRDEDAETPLFAAETPDIARVCLEELSADPYARNNDNQTVFDKLQEDGELPNVCAYIRQFTSGAAPSVAAQTAGANTSATAEAGVVDAGASNSNGVVPPPPLPHGVNINMGTMDEDEVQAAGDPDPEIKRRIEELAQRPDFESDETQAELRKLVTDALGGYSHEAASQQSGRDTKRRAE